MPHLADVPATTMTEQAAGGFNIRTSMVYCFQSNFRNFLYFLHVSEWFLVRKQYVESPFFFLFLFRGVNIKSLFIRPLIFPGWVRLGLAGNGVGIIRLSPGTVSKSR